MHNTKANRKVATIAKSEGASLTPACSFRGAFRRPPRTPLRPLLSFRVSTHRMKAKDLCAAAAFLKTTAAKTAAVVITYCMIFTIDRVFSKTNNLPLQSRISAKPVRPKITTFYSDSGARHRLFTLPCSLTKTSGQEKTPGLNRRKFSRSISPLHDPPFLGLSKFGGGHLICRGETQLNKLTKIQFTPTARATR